MRNGKRHHAKRQITLIVSQYADNLYAIKGKPGLYSLAELETLAEQGKRVIVFDERKEIKNYE
jgi:hypothetical protein